MHYIFIENYLELSQGQKISFFRFMEKHKEFKIIRQELIFEEEAIMLRFEDSLDIYNIQIIIIEYFNKSKIENVNIEIVKKHTTKFDKIILTFIKTNKHILI